MQWLADKLIEDTVRVSAVEGTRLTWICYLNKTVVTAQLVAADDGDCDADAAASGLS